MSKPERGSIITELNSIVRRLRETISAFSRVYSINSRIIGGLVEHALRVRQLMHSLRMMRFVNIQPLLAMREIGAPRIEEEFILTLELLDVTKIRSLLSPGIYSILSKVKKEVERARRLLYGGKRAEGTTDLLETPTLSLMRKTYASSLSYQVVKTAALKYISMIASLAPKFSLLNFREFYKTKIKASPILKSFYEERISAFLRVLKAVDETRRKKELLAREDFEAITEKLQPLMEETYSSWIQEKAGRSLFFDMYVRKMIYYWIALIKSAFSRKLEESPVLLVPKIQENEKVISQRKFVETLLSQPTLEELSGIGKADLESVLLAREYTLGPRIREKLQEILDLAIHGLNLTFSSLSSRLHAGINEIVYLRKSLREVNIQTFIEKFMQSLLHPRTAYFNLATESFVKELETSLSIVSRTGRLIEISTSGKYGGIADVFPAAKSYVRAGDRVSNIIGEISKTISYVATRVFATGLPSSEMKPLVSQSTGYTDLIEKSAAFSQAFSGIKTIMSNIFSPLIYEGLIKIMSRGLATQAYSASIKIPFEGFYERRTLFSQSLRLHEIASVLQTVSALRLPSTSETVRIQHPINVTIRVESLSDESDLRELERKIVKILREEARRYGLNI